MQVFLETEYAGGLLLLTATIAALAWANSPWSGSYSRLWHIPLDIRLGSWSLSETLRDWVNEALMTLFFFVVGLEIKRELMTGELRDRRTAALPVIAAMGGMIGPALIYLAVNALRGEPRGWAVPMATDIAFALGVLSLVGRSLPASLKTFLLAMAIVDDMGAVVVIAVFYSGAVAWPAFGVAGALLLAIVALQRIQVRWTAVYVALGIGGWLATLESGIHATIAGVVLAFLTPAHPFQRPRAVSDEAHRIADETLDEPNPPDADAHQWLRLSRVSHQAVSPLARLQHVLHPWTSFVVLPVFALANAGVSLKGHALTSALSDPVALGIVAGLVIGKPLGIGLAALGAVRIGLARLPAGVHWQHLIAVGTVAGVGFTVSLFIADLAFPSESVQTIAKTSILVASALAALLGTALIGFRVGGWERDPRSGHEEVRDTPHHP